MTIFLFSDTMQNISTIKLMDHAMINVIHTKLGEGRRVAIPVDLCHQYGLEPGDPVVLEASASGIVLRPLDAVIQDVRAFFADIQPKDGLLSEELIRDRRAEADRERRD